MRMGRICSLVLLVVVAVFVQAQQQPLLPIRERVEILLKEMSLDEKINQITNDWHYQPNSFQETIATYSSLGVGQVPIHSTTDYELSPKANLQTRNMFQKKMINSSRLHIPVSFVAEGIHGGAWGGTIFPAPVSLGCTWNVDLVREIASAIAIETRAFGSDIIAAPVVNMFPDPRFGRYAEGFSEDPTLTAALGCAFVQGLQGPTDPEGPWSYLADDKKHVISLAKHYAAYGASAGGQNSGIFLLNNRTLFEIYLKPWRMMAQAGLRGMMTAHQATLDVPMHANSWLVNEVMRKHFGFGDGLVLSDADNIATLHEWGVAANYSHAAALALRSGVDVDLQEATVVSSIGYQAGHLKEAVNEGLLSVEDLNQAVSRSLALKFASGIFDRPVTPDDWIGNTDLNLHRDLAFFEVWIPSIL